MLQCYVSSSETKVSATLIRDDCDMSDCLKLSRSRPRCILAAERLSVCSTLSSKLSVLSSWLIKFPSQCCMIRRIGHKEKASDILKGTIVSLYQSMQISISVFLFVCVFSCLPTCVPIISKILSLRILNRC